MRPAAESGPRAAVPPRRAGSAASEDGPREVVTTGGAPFLHTAAVVRSDSDLFGAAATWVQEGVEADDLVVVGGPPAFLQAMAEEFGEADGVEFDDRVRPNGMRVPDTIASIIALSRRAASGGSGRLRILAQVEQPDDPRAVHEFACLEAASNLMPIAAPLATLCLYDERRVPAALARTAAVTHPNLLEDAAPLASDRFVPPHEFVRGLTVPREPLQDGEPVVAVDDAPTLAGLRHALGDALAQVVRDREQREDVHLAVAETAANAFRHGGRPVSGRLWASDDRLVCTITDRGRGVDPLHGYWPAHGQDLGRGGMGLWLARKLCDHVDIESTGTSTTVRLATALR